MQQFQPKPHYDILDGLRGVAALMVILYHVFECFDWTPLPHGYLAVDFFFVLSGFVIGYAYDGRWREGLTACTPWLSSVQSSVRCAFSCRGVCVGTVHMSRQGG